MSNTPIKKLLISLIFLLFICLSVPLGAAGARVRVTPEQTSVRIEVRPRFNFPSNPGLLPVKNHPLSWSLSPNNRDATLSSASKTDGQGIAWFQVDFGANACGTYTVTLASRYLPLILCEPCNIWQATVPN